jgi:dTDP-4-amino-4,6-dideoxygalactose transaminase
MPTDTPGVAANDFAALWREVRADALDAVDRVGRSGWLILGKEVAEFERAVAQWHGLPLCVGTASGLDALEIALRCCGIGPGDVVLTTPLTAFATTLAIMRVGARPAFVDVDRSGLLDLDAAELALEAHPEIKALVPVHLYGHAMDVDRLGRIGSKYGVAIVEDCAQAIGARHRGRPVGAASPAAATSFYPTKNLGCFGDGGALFARDEAIQRQAQTLRDYGQSSKYVHDVAGMNSRLDELQAALMRSALLPRLSRFTERRRQIASIYRAGIRTGELSPVPTPSESESVWHLFPVIAARREEFVAHMSNRGVACGIHYPVLTCKQRAALTSEPLILGSLTMATSFAEGEVSLPIHPYLTDEEVARVVDACNEWSHV